MKKKAVHCIKAFLLASVSCVTLSGCMTLGLWDDEGSKTVERTVIRKEAMTAAFHTTDREMLCAHFNSDGQDNNRTYLLLANVDPRMMEFVRRNFSSTSPFTVRSVTATIDAFPAKAPEKWTLPTAMEVAITFAVPKEPGIVKVGRDARYQDGSIGPAAAPSSTNRIVNFLAGKVLDRTDGIPMAWVDGKGEVIQDATLFEERSCEEAVQQGDALLIAFATKRSRSL